MNPTGDQKSALQKLSYRDPTTEEKKNPQACPVAGCVGDAILHEAEHPGTSKTVGLSFSG